MPREASAGEGLTAVFVGVLDRFRSRYLLTYTATGVKRGDGWHSVKVAENEQGVCEGSQWIFLAVAGGAER